MLYTCPCCGHFSFGDPPGSYEICEICFWEDDHLQLCFPDAHGGANGVSLIEAQVNYVQWGACERRLSGKVRPVTVDDVKDDRWFALWQRRVALPDEDAPLPGEQAYYWLHEC
ncbi:MAG: hypothetical protein GAK45_02202 [Pseudomonas citronellolis]|nr:MAG: hypothetical protein GAK45_02202 [Pseudomonas citronellolis]